jgi:hypothetical protein
MLRTRAIDPSQLIDQEWISFPGGELEGKRPKTLCTACRQRLRAVGGGRAEVGHRAGPRAGRRLLCFQCYRADLERERTLAAAGQLFTGSAERFQEQLPLEPVNRARLDRLRTERSSVRASASSGAGRFIDRRRAAQIAARHLLAQTAAELRARSAPNDEATRVMSAVVHAAELQLPESWLPFVVSR